MSVFGGDSWGRDAQQRKRRVDDLMLPASGSSSASRPDSFKRLPNGKLACLVCPHRPVLDSPLMLSMHNKGTRHIAAESRLREKELSRQHEINKRLAFSSDTLLPNSSNPHTGVVKEKPLIEQTRRAILEAQLARSNNFSANTAPCDQKKMRNDSSGDSHVSPGISVKSLTAHTRSIECNSSKREAVVGNQAKGNIVSEWQTDFQKRQEQELRFTASGWKWDCHGKWYRDENVEFDSDEDDPNICLG
ncbi:hypothetical protein QOZ80_8AG0634470 [Eleusine coracana subsp. coracana]|nr:hypothetical protein QOZ80_8AG0634470 [Eleusine coracana subsp. coracana]